MNPVSEPLGDLAIKTVAMPADTNPMGNIFGGWVVSQMDLAGMNVTRRFTRYRTVTVAIEKMEFIEPIHVGDFVCCYAKVIKTGRTSVTVNIQTWALSPEAESRRLVTEGVFVYVAVDKEYKPVALESKL